MTFEEINAIIKPLNEKLILEARVEHLTDIIIVLLDALQECEEYFDDRSEMRMLRIVRAAMRKAGPQ